MRVAIVGATGIVGQCLLSLLQAAPWVERITLIASDRSQGRRLPGHEAAVLGISQVDWSQADCYFFTAGSLVSKRYVPMALAAGARVIDNTSCFRMQADVPLLVSGVNDEDVDYRLIANPNCAAIQLSVPLFALQQCAPIEYVEVISMQSVSGAGRSTYQSLLTDSQHYLNTGCSQGMAFDCLTTIGELNDAGVCAEEAKIMTEMSKIFAGQLEVHATCLRVPVLHGHTQAVSLRFAKAVALDDCQAALAAHPLIHFFAEALPTPMQNARGRSDVFVSRLRQINQTNCLNFMVISDNLLRGAASNAFELAEKQWCLHECE